jgi:hypothetical protein
MTCRKHLRVGVVLAVLVTGLAVGGGAAQASALFLDPVGSSNFIPGGQTNDILESIYRGRRLQSRRLLRQHHQAECQERRHLHLSRL